MTGSNLSADTLKNNKDNHAEIIANIEKLQSLEEALIRALDKDSSQTGYVGNQEELIAQINNLSDSRIALFKALDQTYNGVQQNVSNSRVDLVDQLTF